jgi:RNA polymerase sigma-70 factor (ECF subfamily)
VASVDRTAVFEAERARLVGIAARVLAEHAETEDVVQQAWLRLQRQGNDPDSLPAWLTTVTTRLCLDRLRSRTPVPTAEIEPVEAEPDVADEVALADTVGIALQAVLDRLSPQERVAFVLHDSFGFEFATIAAVLDTTPVAARKLASRGRSKVRQLRRTNFPTGKSSTLLWPRPAMASSIVCPRRPGTCPTKRRARR